MPARTELKFVYRKRTTDRGKSLLFNRPMRSRSLLVFSSLVVAGVLAGSYLIAAKQQLFSSHWTLAVSSAGSQSMIGALLETSSSGPLAADLSDTLGDSLLYISRLITSDKQLVIYAAAGFFGLLMMVLAIKNSAPGGPRKTDAMLELLREEKEKAENLARLKSEFLNQVSHELRTPLAVIIGYIECLTDGLYGQIENRHHDILQIVAKQSGHLKNMIDQILIYSRLEASKQPLRIEEFSPVKILLDLRETFDFLCVQKGLQLKWELPRTPLAMKNDPERFKEIASNLLQNAVKYTDQGLIMVCFHDSKASDRVVLEVSDTGVGIPANALGNVFEPFIQVHKTSTENSRGGIGLGLSIVKKHIEQMNGTVNVESELGKGSKFTITFPRLYRHAGKRKYALLRKIKFPFLPKQGYPMVRKAVQHRPGDQITRETGGI
jgi:signal transduction histidine kinase